MILGGEFFKNRKSEGTMLFLKIPKYNGRETNVKYIAFQLDEDKLFLVTYKKEGDKLRQMKRDTLLIDVEGKFHMDDRDISILLRNKKIDEKKSNRIKLLEGIEKIGRKY